MTDSDGRPLPSVVTVWFCPDGEKVNKMATVSTNFHLAADTTFFEILRGACVYYERSLQDMVLRNSAGPLGGWAVVAVSST